MNTGAIEFYSTILAYVQTWVDPEGLMSKVLGLSETSSLSWEATEESVRKLEQCVNRPSEVEDDDELSTTTNDFVKSAFMDLSVLKNPDAMNLFDKLAKSCLPTYSNGEDIFIWARSVKERSDGSAVIVLHVSDLERFREIIERHDLVDDSTECNALEECVQLGS